MNVKILECTKSDVGRQRCLMSFYHMSKLKYDIGDVVKIKISESQQILAKLFLHKCQFAEFIWLDQSVKSCDAYWSSFCREINLKREVDLAIDVERLNIFPAKSIVVKIISSDDHIDYRNKSYINYLRSLLHGYYFLKNHIINLDSSIHDFSKIHSIFIEEVDEGEVGKVASSVFMVNSNTKLQISSFVNKEICDQISSADPGRVYGYENVYEKLWQSVFYPMQFRLTCSKLGIRSSTGILLVGPSGVGKSSMVRSFCFTHKVFLITVENSEILLENAGESESKLRNVFMKAKKYGEQSPCILFFDQIESICPKRSNVTSNTSRILTQMLTLLDGIEDRGNIIILAATSYPNSLDNALRRPGRFDVEINMNLPSKEQRLQILNGLRENSTCDSSANLENVSCKTRGYTGADLKLLWNNAVHDAFKNCLESSKKVTVAENNFDKAMKVRPSSSKTSSFITETSPVYWSDIGGLDNIKLTIKQVVEWPLLKNSAFKRLGLKRPSGILLFGPPGCCKTMLVRAAAYSCNVSFLSVSAAHIYSPYVGESEKLISDVFRQARNCMPCILFMDEVDSLAGSRSSSKEITVGQRILSSLLNEIDGIGTQIGDMPGDQSEDADDFDGVLFIAATNRPDLLDEALLRPGRIDRIVYVPPPNIEDRVSILQNILKNVPKTDIDYNLIAQKTENFSGADIKALCREACLKAMERDLNSGIVSAVDFEDVMTNFSSSISHSQLDFYNKFNEDHNFVLL